MDGAMCALDGLWAITTFTVFTVLKKHRPAVEQPVQLANGR